MSTAFGDANLRGDKDALAWLNGTGPRSVMDRQTIGKRRSKKVSRGGRAWLPPGTRQAVRLASNC
jgi:hypothetical protein